jgi:hypothetical protein
LPATAQQSDTTSATGFKAKFKEKRAKFASRMKTIYFAAGCKILDNEARASLVDAEAARVFVRQKADPKVDDLKKEAEQDGLACASRPGECDYFLKNPGGRRGHPQSSERSQGRRAQALTLCCCIAKPPMRSGRA